MKKELDMVAKFHKKFGFTMNNKPTLLSKADAEFRHQLTVEEVDECLEGNEECDLPNVAKELADVLFAVYGTVVAHGLQDIMPEVYEEVYRSNMSKDVDKNASTTKPSKGKDYIPADVERLLK